MVLDDPKGKKKAPNDLPADVQMAPAPNVSLWCVLEGDPPPFQISVPSGTDVDGLKDAIKDENTPELDHLPSRRLRLFQPNTNVPLSPRNTLLSRLPAVESWKELEEHHEVSSVLEPLTPNHLHIIVRRPSEAIRKRSRSPSTEAGDHAAKRREIMEIPPIINQPNFNLNCVVFGDDSSGIFRIKIARTEIVDTLRDEIKNKIKPLFDRVPITKLDLWKVSIPAGTNLREDVNNLSLPDKDPLQPVWKLSDVFSDQPDGKYLHIVVRSSLDRSVHSVCGVTKAREEWTKNFPSRAPSEMGKTKQFASHQRKAIPPFYFNRPPSTAATIPITLYEPIFAQFQDDCETYMPTQEDHAFVLKHTLSMSNFYDTEKARAEQSRADMATYGLDFLATEIRNYCTNGDLRCGEFCYSLLEYKGEIGLTGAEPLFQAGGYYAAFTRDYCKANWFSHLPCFILYAFGAHIGFAGAIWTDRPHLQVLSPTLPLFYHATDTGMRERAARYFGAAKKAILALRDYYENVLPIIRRSEPTNIPNPMFPNQTQYTSLEDPSIQTKFMYVTPLEEDKLVFRCVTIDHTDHTICVKFVRRYSKEAHIKCASLGFAPALRGFQSIGGGWSMIVMDFVDDSYQLLEDSNDKASFSSEFKEKLVSFHQAGYVHGDIRTTNIMVKKTGEPGIILLDFDWAGKVGEVRYPMNVNNRDIKRPDGAVDGRLILAEHDIEMMDFMFLW